MYVFDAYVWYLFLNQRAYTTSEFDIYKHYIVINSLFDKNEVVLVHVVMSKTYQMLSCWIDKLFKV